MANRTLCLNREKERGWIMKEGVLGYVIDCYRGVEKTPSKGIPRRVFEWAEGEGVYRGNAEAFLIHLGLKFGLDLKPTNACMVHAILRELGEQVLSTKKERRRRDPNSPLRGRFRQPDPDKRKVR